MLGLIDVASKQAFGRFLVQFFIYTSSVHTVVLSGWKCARSLSQMAIPRTSHVRSCTFLLYYDVQVNTLAAVAFRVVEIHSPMLRRIMIVTRIAMIKQLLCQVKPAALTTMRKHLSLRQKQVSLKARRMAFTLVAAASSAHWSNVCLSLLFTRRKHRHCKAT